VKEGYNSPSIRSLVMDEERVKLGHWRRGTERHLADPCSAGKIAIKWKWQFRVFINLCNCDALELVSSEECFPRLF